MTIWSECQGEKHGTTINENPWRVIESQSILNSRRLVDSAEEFDILEEMLESSKPPADINSHYLIYTQFRYPPLRYGSRFGSKFEASLWYGSLDIETALSEVAYYRLLFHHHTEAELNYLTVSLTAFQVLLKTDKAIDLSAKPFNQYQQQLSAKTNYTDSQQLGRDMRAAGIEAFIYHSARSTNEGKNIAAFTATVFQQKNKQYAFNFCSWQCIASKNTVDFVNPSLERKYYTVEDFSSHNSMDVSPEWVELSRY